MKSPKNEIYPYICSLAERMLAEGRHRTSQIYLTALNAFVTFAGKSVRFPQLDSELMSRYESWLLARGLVPNSVSFHMRVLRAAYNRAVCDGLTDDRRPFQRVYTGVARTRKRALTLNTLRAVKNLSLPDKSDAAFARDMFMLSFYLRGMSFVDMAFLQKCDLRCGWLTYRRRKTGQLLTVAWTPEMQSVIDRYPVNVTQYLLPIITDRMSDDYHQYKSCQYRINRNLKRIGCQIGLREPLTMYCSRHTWASIAKMKGVPLSVISDGLGHDSETTTRIYLATLDTSAVDSANQMILGLL